MEECRSLFCQNEYLLGNLAFQPCACIVPAFKTANGIATNCNKAVFNQLLSSPRVKSEHCIGILKGQFAYQSNICIQIKSANDLKKKLKFVKAAVILHNLLIGEVNMKDWLNETFLPLGDEDKLNANFDGLEGDMRRSHLLGYFSTQGIGGII